MDRITPPATADDASLDHILDLRQQVGDESAHGRALVADIGDNPVGTLTFDSVLRCIELTWRGYATDLQIRYIHEVVLVLLRNHGLSKLLCDNTRLPTFGQDILAWITSDWMPRAKSAGLRAAAATESTSVFASRSLHQLVDTASAAWAVGFFDDADKARDWLHGYTPET